MVVAEGEGRKKGGTEEEGRGGGRCGRKKRNIIVIGVSVGWRRMRVRQFVELGYCNFRGCR